MSLSNIEKVFECNYNGYTFRIERNGRKDCKLSMITNSNNTQYIEKIVPIRSWFLTLKAAKNHAIEMIKKTADQA